MFALTVVKPAYMVGYDHLEAPKSPRSMTPNVKNGKVFDFDIEHEVHSERSSSDPGFMNNSDNKSDRS